MEIVVDGVIGYLCDSVLDKFFEVMSKFVEDENLYKKLGEVGK